MNVDHILYNLWTQSVEYIADDVLAYILLTLLAVGTLQRSHIFDPKKTPQAKDGYMAAFIVAVVCLFIICALAFMPYSPLLNIRGTLLSSPWLYGLYPIICFDIVVVCIVYGLIGGTIRSFGDCIDALCTGFVKYPWLILIGMIC